MGLTTRRLAVAVLTVATLAGLSMDARAQELEPRRWSNVPVGLNFVAFAYSYSTGNILLDTTLPIEDLQADISGAALRYVRTLDLGGVSATVDATVPFTSADFSAIVDGVFTTATRDGFGDPRVRLAVNFLGAPALGVSEFASFEQTPEGIPGDRDHDSMHGGGTYRQERTPGRGYAGLNNVSGEKAASAARKETERF